MKFSIKPSEPSKLDADVLILYVWEDGLISYNQFPDSLNSVIKEAAEREDFKGREKQYLVISTRGLISSYKLLLCGIGKKEEYDISRLYQSLAQSVKKSEEYKPVKIAIAVHDDWLKLFEAKRCVQSIIETVRLSTYLFDKYKGDEEKKNRRPIEEVYIAVSPPKIAQAEEGVDAGTIIADAVCFARDLVNEPAEVTSPQYLADTAIDIAKNSDGQIKVKILEIEEMKKLGMNAFLGVAKGSHKPPKFIHLSYKPSRPAKKIILIGKGITFDTGGLSLKGSEHMETMKQDMAGGAAVLAIFSQITSLSVKAEVIGIIAACENMPGGNALKPGDILKAMNGKTIEVLNTDAEGRLTLADAISYASLKDKPDEIIDIATLCGACVVALGTDITGMWGNDEKLLGNIEKYARLSGEHIWRMPLFKDYMDLMKSSIADIKNVQMGRYGGAITGALFLSEFVEKIPWVHLDIAGPAYTEKDSPLIPHGGTGFGVRLLLEYIVSL